MGAQYQGSIVIPAGSTAPIPVTGLGHSPAVLIVTWNGADDAVDAAEGVSSLRGVSIIRPGELLSISEVLRDGQSFMVARGRVDSDRVIQEFSEVGAELGRLNLTSLDADGFTVTPGVAFTSPVRARFLSWSAALVPQADLFTFNHSGGPGDQDLTAPGFQPDAAIFVAPNAVASVGSPFTIGAGLAMGFAAGPNGSIANACAAVYSDAGNPNANSARGAGLSGFCLLQLSDGSTPTGAVDYAGRVTQWLPTGLRLNAPVDPVGTTSRLVICLAMRGNFHAGSFLSGAAAIEGSPVPPSTGLFYSAGLPATAAPPSVTAESAHALVGFASLNENEGLEQSCMATLDVGGVSPRDVSRRIDFDAILAGLAPGGSALGELRIDLPTAEGYQLETVEAFAPPVHVAYLLAGVAAGEGVTHGRMATVAAESRAAVVPAEPDTAGVP